MPVYEVSVPLTVATARRVYAVEADTPEGAAAAVRAGGGRAVGDYVLNATAEAWAAAAADVLRELPGAAWDDPDGDD